VYFASVADIFFVIALCCEHFICMCNSLTYLWGFPFMLYYSGCPTIFPPHITIKTDFVISMAQLTLTKKGRMKQ